MILIGLTGKAGHGKSTLASYLAEIGFVSTSFALPLKVLAMEYFKLSEAEVFTTKPPHARTIMQGLGTLIREQFDEQYFLRAMASTIQQLNAQRIVIDDLRLVEEAQLVRDMGGLVVKIVCPDAPERLSAAQQAHKTEQTDLILADQVISVPFGEAAQLKSWAEYLAAFSAKQEIGR